MQTLNKPPEHSQENEPIRKQLESPKFKTAIANVLPAHLTPDRFARIAVAALTRVPKLAQCDPNTILTCLMQLSQFGLEPDGRNAHLVPFWNTQRSVFECVLIVDYKGLVALALRSGRVSFIHADKVCENDGFEWNKGQVVRHEINFKEDRGKAYAYYSIVKMKDGTEMANAMTKAEVELIRNRSKSKNNGPWVTDFDEMAKKTVFRRLSKWIELSPEFRDALEADTDLEELRFEQAKPVIERANVKRELLPPNGSETTEEEQPPQTTASPQSEAHERDSSPPGHYDQPPQPEPTTRLKSKKKAKAKEPEQPLRKEMMSRLGERGKTTGDLVAVCRANDWIDAGEDWPLSEERLAKLLHEDNWPLVSEELSAA